MTKESVETIETITMIFDDTVYAYHDNDIQNKNRSCPLPVS